MVIGVTFPLSMSLRGWGVLINPPIIIMLFFAVLSDAHRDANIFQYEYQYLFIIFSVLVYWIPAAYVTIKIIEWSRDIWNSRKSNL